MPQIAISYRRADSMAITGRIYDRLVQQFGAASVFIDLEGIPAGADFRQHIDEVLRASDTLIVIIGRNWIGADRNGSPRIMEPSDPVRIEVETALALKTRLIPVLVDDAVMPAAADLPPSLAEFAYRNAIKVDAGRDFGDHVNRLIRELAAKPAAPEVAGNPRQAAPATVVMAYVVVPLTALLLAHYLFVIRFDLHTAALRMAAMAIPLAAGFWLFRADRQRFGDALLVGVAVAVLAVAGMHLITWLIAGDSLWPAEPAEWQVAFEFFASIVLSAIAGYLLARALHAVGWWHR
ncbi:MAG: toll/interleukin-1 receptor domain-containing protein [Hyphomicrobiales bacterium]|nr:toll/interleukin-1 receptor domain-containing protein [Hyphomicrobiales bacterium]